MNREPLPEPSYVHHPRLGRGIVWSDLVAEMEEEWAARQAAPSRRSVAVFEADDGWDGEAVAA